MNSRFRRVADVLDLSRICSVRTTRDVAFFLLFGFVIITSIDVVADEPTYAQTQTVLTKYCAGCHNANDANGEFTLHTLDGLFKGGEHGNAITPGSAKSSLMIELMRRQRDPAMPPAGEPTPNDDEVQLVADWIDAGAKGPEGVQPPNWVATPKIESKVSFKPVTALASSADGTSIAVARFKTIEIRDATALKVLKTFEDLPGKINSVAFLKNGDFLIVGTGIAGLFGEAIIIRVADGEIIKRFRGHGDLVYSVAVSHNEKLIATSSYDRKSVLWKIDSDQPIGTFIGHSDAVFENAFDPTGEILVTASADGTVKVWRVSDRMRLDTRGEPLQEQYTVAISPDGKWMVGGGEDNRIRKWQLVSRNPNQTNPLVISRFADEAAIQLLRFHDDGKHLVSVSGIGTIKIWDTATLTQKHVFDKSTRHAQAIAVTPNRIIVGSMDGSLDILKWPADLLAADSESIASTSPPSKTTTIEQQEPTEQLDVEPNDLPADAVRVEAPFKVAGAIHADNRTDVDTFRFTSKKDERWMIEIRARRDDSPLDSHVAVLNTAGQPVPRVLLQAVRDSYFTFRGKDSKQTGDFRIHNWEEMKLNQLLYCNGEVVKLFHYPRGPDSGFNVYPNFGNRHGMFDTTPITHALHEPCYIVEAYPPGTELPATGLPQFLLNFENDDDAQRELGTDSRLTFVAPTDGDFLIQVRDTRDLGGEDFKYQLTVVRERPSFGLNTIGGANPTLVRGVYKKFGVSIDRKDNFDGPVHIDIEDLPEGIKAEGPITIERGALRAFFTLYAAEDAPTPSGDQMSSTVTATALIAGKQVRRTTSLGPIKFDKDPKLKVTFSHSPDRMPHFNQSRHPVLEIRPGETITAQVSVARSGHTGRISFGSEDAALNLPFGVYVDNTGLNGVLIPPGESTRTIFLTAESWVQPCERLIFLEATQANKPSSNPAALRVLPK